MVVVLAALATCCLAVMAFSANSAKASTAGAPINFEFNYVGLTIGTTVAGDIDSLVLTPSTEAGDPPALLGPLQITGTYDDANGNFTVTNDGFDFPKIGVNVDVATIDGEIALAEAAHGNYNAATGAMTFAPKIKLTLGTDHIENLPDPIGGFGTGPLRCEFSPLDLSLSSSGTWPHDAAAFTDKANIKEGSVSGAFRYLPKVKTIEGGTLCPLVGGILQPVGGLWLAQSDTLPELSAMPAATGTKPDPLSCVLPQTGTYPDCKDPVCPTGQVGTPPNCTTPVVTKDPADLSGSTATKALTVKQGKKGTISVSVKNSGESDATGVKVCTTIAKSFAKAPKCASVGTLAAGASKTVKMTITLGKKAKGKKTATTSITSNVATKSLTTKVTAKVVKKKKKK